MKKVLVTLFVLFAIFEGVVALAANQPHNLGYVALAISSGTRVEIQRSTAPTVGYLRYCTNCGGGVGAVCVSTGSTKFGSYVPVWTSTGGVCQ